MTKIVYNDCYGGFGLSQAAVERFAEIKGVKLYPETNPKFRGLGLITYWTVPESERGAIVPDDAFWQVTPEQRAASNEAYTKLTVSPRDIQRDDPVLAQVVEELGARANGAHASLAIRDLPAGTQYRIDEYDGNERVMTVDDYDWSIA